MARLRIAATGLLLVFVVFTCGFAVGKEVGARGALEGVRSRASLLPAATSVAAKRIVARYFHSTKRCTTCNTIEAYAKDVLDTRFADAIQEGTIVWTTANMDDAWNAEAVERYGLMRSSLVLADMRRDEENDYVVLKRVWDLTGDKEAFAAYVESAIEMILADWTDEDEEEGAEDER